MKKSVLVIITVVLCLLIVLVGCSSKNDSNYNANNDNNSSTVENTAKQLSLNDYEIIPGVNVSDTRIGTNNENNEFVAVYCICPICGNEDGYTSISFDEVKDRLGQNVFAYSGFATCSNWDSHPEFSDTDYTISVTFQIKQ